MIYSSGGIRYMKIKIVGLFVCMLMITTILPMTALAGDPENPEVKDRTRDVRLFGLFPLVPQFPLSYIDIVSAWMYEEEDHPENLYVSLKLMDLNDATQKYDAIYVIDWNYQNIPYSAGVHIYPTGPTALYAGRWDEQGNDYVNYVICDGTIDSSIHIITWIIPKDAIGNPSKGSTIKHIAPFTDLRYPEGSGIPMFDLFKDLASNALVTKDYQIQY
jgi:hypothetical protein